MDQMYRRHIGIHTAKAEVGQHGLRLRRAGQVLQQDVRLFKLPGQSMAVVGISGKRTCTDDQALLLR
jgi:hypothetical protein